MSDTLERRDLLGVTLIAEPGLTVDARDLSAGSPIDCVTLRVGQLEVIGGLDEIGGMAARITAQVERIRVERMLEAEQCCLDGDDHPLTTLEDLGGGRTAVECAACKRSFVQEDDGTLVPLTRTPKAHQDAFWRAVGERQVTR